MGANREDALSDALGAILLVAVVGMAVGILGVAILSQPPAEKIPALNVDITPLDSGKTILITHNGGDSLAKSEMAIIIDGSDETNNFTRFGETWSTWSVGDSLNYTVSGNLPAGVSIYYIGGSSAYLIQSMGVPSSYLPGTTTPVPTSTTTPAPTDPVFAGFAASPVTGLAPLSVQFVDASTGPVTSWAWTFGDGSTSSLQNPLYTYPDMGMYPVSLTVSNGTGSDTLTRADYVTVGAPVTGTITLNRPTGPAYVEPGSTLQFRVQPGWATFTLDGSMQVLSSGNVVQFVWGSDGYGSISSTASSINSMLDFTDVSVYVNGVLIGRGTLNSVFIANCDQYQSTIVLTMPPSAEWTSLNVDGTPVPVTATDTVRIAGLGSAMNLNAQTGSIWYSGGAASYIVY